MPGCDAYFEFGEYPDVHESFELGKCLDVAHTLSLVNIGMCGCKYCIVMIRVNEHFSRL